MRPATLRDVLRRALAWRPDERYPDAAALTQALRAAVERPMELVDASADPLADHDILYWIADEREQYPSLSSDFQVRQAVGIDTSELLVARTGIRGSNDLVWVGRSANLAAKLCSLREGGYASWITGDVYDKCREDVKIAEGRSMWERRSWTAQNGMTV